jgi:hypothetical protein
MHRRRVRTLAIAFAVAGLALAPAASARRAQPPLVREQLEEIGAWAVPATPKVLKPHAGRSQKAIVREQLAEIGAWAVPR